MMSKRQNSYLRKDAALKTGLRPFSISKHRLRFREATKQQQSLIYSQITVRGGQTADEIELMKGRNLYWCYVTVSREGHVTIIVTPRNCDISLEFMPLSHGAVCGTSSSRVNVQIGIYISSSSGKLWISTSWSPIGWDHPILLSDWRILSDVSLPGSPHTAQWNLKWPGPCHTCGPPPSLISGAGGEHYDKLKWFQ